MANTRVACFAVLFGCLALLAGCGQQRPQPLGPGATAPPLTANGWINGQGPKPEELQGKVVVVDIWAFWCEPCRKAIPELIKAHDHYRDRDDVVFLGLTPVGNEGRESSKDFVRQLHVPWVNGIGAQETIDKLHVYLLPTVFVIGRDGRVVWNSEVPGEMTAAIDTALARGE